VKEKREVGMSGEPKVVFEDESLVVIDKPAGMVVIIHNQQEETVQQWFGTNIIFKYQLITDEFLQKGGVVHRLIKIPAGSFWQTTIL
jgi:23S rRNA-/tRNA-specific pseudouridylate synthase